MFNNSLHFFGREEVGESWPGVHPLTDPGAMPQLQQKSSCLSLNTESLKTLSAPDYREHLPVAQHSLSLWFLESPSEPFLVPVFLSWGHPYNPV